MFFFFVEATLSKVLLTYSCYYIFDKGVVVFDYQSEKEREGVVGSSGVACLLYRLEGLLCVSFSF